MEFVKGWGGLYYLLAVLGAGMLLELAIPWRKGVKIDPIRWLRNASMAFYATVLLGLLPAIAAYGAAVTAQANGIGVMNMIAMPLWARLAISVLILDVVAYGEHRALHRWYFLWRIHRTHHTDVHLDASTSLRFHPLETIFRACVEFIVVFLTGIPPEGILLIYLVHVVVNVYTHGNFNAPIAIEKKLSAVFTTPSVHRLHHSTDEGRQYANFGTFLTVWDRLFGTFVGAENLRKDERFGVDGPEAMEADTFANLALDPFRKPKGGAIPRPAPLGKEPAL